MTLTIRDVHPVNDRYGMGRGTPIARYYINRYFESARTRIRGTVLEFGQPTYAEQLDCRYETISIVPEDRPTLEMDICDEAVVQVRPRHYDFIICTSVVQLVPEPRRAVQNMHRLLKPGGTLVIAEKCVSIVDPWFGDLDKWRFTPAGMAALLTDFATVEVQGFGNLYTMCAYLSGLTADEIPQDKLHYHDPVYPILSIASATSASR